MLMSSKERNRLLILLKDNIMILREDLPEIIRSLRNTPRRGGLQTELQHALLVAELSVWMASNLFDLSECTEMIWCVAITHDIGEVCPDLWSSISSGWCLSPAKCKMYNYVYLFTRKDGESSSEHSMRVKCEGDVIAHIVKMCDNIVNSSYTDEEKFWHNNLFGYDFSIDRDKYTGRARDFFSIITNNTKMS